MSETFGAQMRQRRERQQIALATIAEQTKINVALLEALERDDVSHWPSGIFRRAFIRAYAHAIGLDPGVVVREFLEIHPDPSEDVATLPAINLALNQAKPAGPPTRFRYLVGSAIGSISKLRGGVLQKHETAAEIPAASDPIPVPVKPSAPPAPDLLAVAKLCTDLARIDDTRDATPLLQDVARMLDAVGLIVWISNPQGTELRPLLTHGYSDKVLAQIPRVERDADNATAAAFRLAEACVVDGRDSASGALVVPLMSSMGCVGVLAIELPRGNTRHESMRALATIFAAQLSKLVCAVQPAEAADRRLA